MGPLQARSQDLEKGGGLFWKSEKSANDLDPNFHCPWISVTRFLQKSRRHFSEISEFQTFYLPEFRWSPKKKKRSSPILRLVFRPKSKIQTFFFAQFQVISKKKKVFTDFETGFSAKIGNSNVFFSPKFRPKSENRTFEGGLFSDGGAIFNFSPKIGLKSTKNVRFCILYKPMGRLLPPPPPLPGYATGPLVVNINIKLLLIAVVRMYCCTPKTAKRNWINRLCVIIFMIIIGSFTIGGEAKGPVLRAMPTV